jgi:hypothetical protein
MCASENHFQPQRIWGPLSLEPSWLCGRHEEGMLAGGGEPSLAKAAIAVQRGAPGLAQ